MTNVVAYAYTHGAEQRPALRDQFIACRDHAATHGYTIVGEFNDIDESDHQAMEAVLGAIRAAIADHGASAILVYQPSAWALERLNGLGVGVETVATLPPRQEGAPYSTS